jgi:hypothetical protein
MLLRTLHRRLGLTQTRQISRIPSTARQLSSTTQRLSTPASRPPPPPRRSNRESLPLLPLVAIFCLGSGAFHFLAKSREGQTHQRYTAGDKAPADKGEWPGRRRDTEQ